MVVGNKSTKQLSCGLVAGLATTTPRDLVAKGRQKASSSTAEKCLVFLANQMGFWSSSQNPHMKKKN
jgi:hypothetical protein